MTLLFIFLGLFLGLILVGNNLIIFLLLSVILIIFTFKRFNKKVCLLFTLSILVGIGVSFINLQLNPKEGTYLGLVIEAHDNYFIVLSKFEKLYVYQKDNTREFGDIIKITGQINDLVDTSLESEFSFVQYLNNKGISRQINFSEINVVFNNFIKLNTYKRTFLSLFSVEARDYVDAFLFNVKNYEATSTSLMNSLNLTYLFSSSGIYLALMFRFNEYFLRLKFNEKHTRLLSMLILGWYLIFALNRVGIRRLIYLKIFSYINDYHLKHKYSYLERLSLVAIFMLSINHHLAYQSSFYFGLFLALTFYFSKDVLMRGKKRYKSLKTSLLVFLFVLPFSLSMNHELHLLTFLFEITLFPLTFIFFFCALFSFYTYPINPLFTFLSNILTNSLKGLKVIDLNISFKEFGILFVVLYYFFLFSTLYFLESYSKKKVSECMIASLLLLLIKIVPFEMLYAQSITFLNVGQGDCTLIRYYDQSIMIDTGGLTYKDIATEVTIPYLHKQGINQLDYVFISHADYDHSGALTSLINNFSVKHVIKDQSPFIITINDLTIKNINEWASMAKDENDRSQVLSFSLAKRNFLMMGDASSLVEQKIIEKYRYHPFKVDVLKAGHHGSSTSSSYEFLKFIQPKEVVISVGKNNSYGHPSKTVLNYLDELKIPYQRTDEQGSISYYQNAFLKA